MLLSGVVMVHQRNVLRWTRHIDDDIDNLILPRGSSYLLLLCLFHRTAVFVGTPASGL